VFTNPDGTTTTVSSPDPGRALINGSTDFESVTAFKIPSLWGVSRTAPYFHDNSAKTLEEVMQHYARFFAVLGLTLTEQDQKDLVAYVKLMQ
jgi:cytochrome c peroxidase